MLPKSPAIVILDEATSHLDSENESARSGRARRRARRRTSIVIAHRLSTITQRRRDPRRRRRPHHRARHPRRAAHRRRPVLRAVPHARPRPAVPQPCCWSAPPADRPRTRTCGRPLGGVGALPGGDLRRPSGTCTAERHFGRVGYELARGGDPREFHPLVHDMARHRTFFSCTDCGTLALQWAGSCRGAACGTRCRRDRAVPGACDRRHYRAAAIPRSTPTQWHPRPTGIDEFDRVLGGGLVAGSVTLVGGEPRIAKSTLLLAEPAALGRTQRCTVSLHCRLGRSRPRRCKGGPTSCGPRRRTGRRASGLGPRATSRASVPR